MKGLKVAKFSAESLDPIEYDFTGFNSPDGKPINDKGAIPEPSRAQVNAMMNDVQNAFKDLGLGEDSAETPEKVVETMNAMNSSNDGEDEDKFAKMSEHLVDAMADLCGGSPSKKSLEDLPYRAFMAFFGYLMGEVMSPEASAPVTKNSPRTLRSV
jgi:hypothetical protein